MLGINGKQSNTETGSVNLIGGGTKIVGDINSNGDIRIDGYLVGNLSTNGKFVLGPQGVIEGNVISGNADISGEIKGTIKISESLSLKKTARIQGDIITGKLAIESGAIFNGTCNMGAKVKNINQPGEGLNAASKTA
ncbi:MAG: polymer-forming cytoskeletal protein [Sphingobacteriaceae bacterium]|nr:polymer-forming cytoskeletal protein [Sphingobacteriaceae bacterium]